MNGARRVRRLRVSEQRMETLLENPCGDLEKPREVVGLAVLPDGTIVFDVPRSNRVWSIPGDLAGKKIP
jgi:hypothetical protein